MFSPRIFTLRLFLLIGLIPMLSHAALFKCREHDGRFSYSDQPCAQEEVPMSQQGSLSSVKIIPRVIPPSAPEGNSSGGVSSSGSSSGGSSSSGSSSSKSPARSHY
jgi:uncharacterized membrane protein YgcG